MATVKGPLMSLEAHGSIGSTLTYEQYRGMYYCKSYSKPSEKKTEKQAKSRSVFKEAVATYRKLVKKDREAMDCLTIGQVQSGYNLYVKWVMDAINRKKEWVVIKKVKAGSILMDQAYIYCFASVTCKVEVMYGGYPGIWEETVVEEGEGTDPEMEHEVLLTNLAPDSEVWYTVKLWNENGQLGRTGYYTFHTLAE